MVLKTVHELVDLYKLERHPEGGFFKETYRSEGKIEGSLLPEGMSGSRSFATAIYFLIPEENKSCLHRILSDEIWHFYIGGSLTLVQIFQDGRLETTVLGADLDSGQKLQHVVPAGCWFGAYANSGAPYAFVGCTVSPGFDFLDFEMGEREHLIETYPHLASTIVQFTNE